MKCEIDLTAITDKKIHNVWNFGFNTCHAALWLREDLPAQADRIKELGFRYVRFHNTISGYTGIYSEDSEGNPVYSFDKLDRIMDRVLKAGYYPFWEISYCPELLAPKKQKFLYYECYNVEPVNFKRWDELIREIVRHFLQRYGLECVKEWYFEVWNEPDIAYGDKTPETYFRLYDHTVLAVKSVCSQLRVGGPATSKCLWIEEFIRHVEQGSEISGFQKIPCDFISTHCYPSDLTFLPSAVGEVNLQNSNIMYEMFAAAKKAIEKSSLKGLPLIMGEWNSSAGPLAMNHDEKNNGAFIVKIFDELQDVIDGSLYWNMSDIYEEVGFHYTPFHGGYGLMTVNDIPKSSYNAFALLNEMKGRQVYPRYEERKNGVGVLAAVNDETKCLNILLYHYVEPDEDCPQACDVEIILNGLEKACVSSKTTAVTDESGSAYEWWIKMGRPDFLNLEKLKFLMKKSRMEQNRQVRFREKDRNEYRIHELLQPSDVKLIQIYPGV